MATFVDAYNKALDVTRRLPVGALAAMDGWEPVNPADVIPAALDSNVKEITDAVGNDPVKAAAALAVENEKDNPRVTLVAALTRITHEKDG